MDFSFPMAHESSVHDSLDELDNFSDSGSDYEATLKPSKRKKLTLPKQKLPKRLRSNAAARMLASPHTVSPQEQPGHSHRTSTMISPGPVARNPVRNQEISAKDIYDAICSGKSAIVTVVDEWLDSYKRSREAGLLVLVNFIVQSCGCKGVVSREMYDSMETADIISALTRNFNEDSADYPVSVPGPKVRGFKASLCEFVRVLVRSCQNSFIFDEYLFSSLLVLLTGLSDSLVRAFRHTSTLLAMKLMTALVEVSVVVSVQLQTTQRRYDMENSRSPSDRQPGRLENLQAAITELKNNTEELSSLMNAAFRGVFVNRYRDLLPDIRAFCIEEIGQWIKINPDIFLNDGCLKYLGWMLNDKQSSVRLECVRALQGLYQEREFIGRLEFFTSRFKERLLSMVLDIDSNVAMEVVNLLLLIQRTRKGLSEKECGSIYPLVYSSHRGLTAAAGVFLYNKLKTVIDGRGTTQGEKNHNAAFLQLLITFFIQTEYHEHGAYLVDSLWGVAGSELRDWETMTSFLLQDATDNEGLMYEEEEALIDLMICAMRQASEATPPVGRTSGKKTLSVKDKKTQEQDRRRITTHFIPLLPLLLAKYSADAGLLPLLLRAPLYFELEMYSKSPVLKKHLQLLLVQICGILEKHNDDAVLEACAKVISTLSSQKQPFSTVQQTISQLMDSLTEYFNSHLTELQQGTADENVQYSVAITLKRIAALSSAMDPTSWKLFDSCLELLTSSLQNVERHSELMVAALKCAAMHLMWAKVNAVNSSPLTEEVTALKRNLQQYCEVVQSYLSVVQVEIRDKAFELLCDLLLLYSARLVSSKKALNAPVWLPSDSLVFLPSHSLRSELAGFVLDNIFPEAEDLELGDAEDEEQVKLTLFQRKRNQLAGYCKLISYGVLELSDATNIFKHYNSKHFKDFGDIMKEMLTRTKMINPVQSAKTVCLCLQQLFSEMLMEAHSRKDLLQICDLAKKFAMSFGIDLQRASKPLVALHIQGMEFAFRASEEEQYPHLDFLEILTEFTSKLLPKSRDTLLTFLKQHLPTAALSWPAVKLYQRCLNAPSGSRSRGRKDSMEGEEEEESVSFRGTPLTKRRRTTAEDSASSATMKSLSSLHSPKATSTALKQPVTKKHKTTEVNENALNDLESEDEFFSGSQMRKVKPTPQRQPSSSLSVEQQDLNSHLDLLSLMEEDNSVQDEPEIEEYDSDSEDESGYRLPSTRNTSLSFMDELFD